MLNALANPYVFFLIQVIIIVMVYWHAFKVGRKLSIDVGDIVNGTILWMIDNNYASGSENPDQQHGSDDLV